MRIPGALVDDSRQVLLVEVLDALPFALECGIGRQRLELAEFVLEVGNPSVANLLRDQGGEPRIAQQHPAPRGHAVGDVAELLRFDRVEIT